MYMIQGHIMKTQVYEITLFWDVFQTNKHLMLFAFGEFIRCSRHQFMKLPNGSSFIYLGQEWRINNRLIERV